MDIQVDRLTLVTGKGNLRAYADVVIGGLLTIRGCRIVQQPGQQPWVSMPQQGYTKDGKKNYYPIIRILDKQLEQEIKQAVLTVYRDGEKKDGRS